MALGSNRLYGRRHAIELVREFMTREDKDDVLHNQHFPILVLEGFRGAGKTALLAELVDLLDQRVPYARLDFEANKLASVPEALRTLAFELSRKCPRYGTLRFPRFIIGWQVMQLKLDQTDRFRACRQVVDALKRRHGAFAAVSEALAETVDGVANTVGASAGVPVRSLGRAAGFILMWLATAIPNRRMVFIQNWYGHRDRRLSHDPVDRLVDLNSWAVDPEYGDGRRRIDELLWDAFLADLRGEFGRPRRVDERTLNCVILLDNADTELGRRFLQQLVWVRRQRTAGDQNGADPLTVVATSRGALLAHRGALLGPAPGAEQASGRSENGRSGHLVPATDWSPYWWRPYRLPDLTEDQVGTAVADLGLSWSDNQRLARLVYQLTGGHPAATWLVLDAIRVAAESAQQWIDPKVVLSRMPPGPASGYAPTVEDQMLDGLLMGVTDAQRRDLETCAAARNREQAFVLAGRDGLLICGQAHYEEILDPILWSTDGSAGSVLLRRLLRRRLARRDPAGSPSWEQVYAELGQVCRDEAGRLYCALATGDLATVSRRLREVLTELDGAAWLELLTSVTKAPLRHRCREAPADAMRTLLAAAGLTEHSSAAVAQLVAALWIVADPFTDSRRRALHLQIGDSYSEVSRFCPDGSHGVFLEAARRHRREAELWD
ncbi:MAG: hypothetical protein ACRDRV_10635 [Pseudonocardiaceae bacterium]